MHSAAHKPPKNTNSLLRKTSVKSLRTHHPDPHPNPHPNTHPHKTRTCRKKVNNVCFLHEKETPQKLRPYSSRLYRAGWQNPPRPTLRRDSKLSTSIESTHCRSFTSRRASDFAKRNKSVPSSHRIRRYSTKERKKGTLAKSTQHT